MVPLWLSPYDCFHQPDHRRGSAGAASHIPVLARYQRQEVQQGRLQSLSGSSGRSLQECRACVRPPAALLLSCRYSARSRAARWPPRLRSLPALACDLLQGSADRWPHEQLLWHPRDPEARQDALQSVPGYRYFQSPNVSEHQMRAAAPS